MGWIIGLIGGVFGLIFTRKRVRVDLGFGRLVSSTTPFKIGFGWRRATKEMVAHSGIDLSLPVGTQVLAAADGIVKRLSKTVHPQAGIYVEILHDNGMLTRYLHFSKALVNLNQRVKKGQVIGLSGNTGLSEGPHLHFEIRVPNELLLGGIRDAVGEPRGGFDRTFPGIGVGIPAEPWIPVDGYSQQVINNARAYGVPLYGER